MSELKEYRSKPVTVKAVQWETELGASCGVMNKPKKHEMNPDDFHIRNRFGKEKKVKPGDWVLTFGDGSHDVIEGAAFPDIYEEVPCPTTE